MTAERGRRSVHFLGCNRLEASQTLPDSFTQARGMIGSEKDPMKARGGNALSLWTLLVALGIRTSSASAWSLRAGAHETKCFVPLEY